MVTYDLRGHGNSDKPLEPERYKDSKAWADELQAVMDATGIKRPVLAGWSYGGRIMADYLRIKVIGRGPITREECLDYFGERARTSCGDYPSGG